MYWQRCWHDFVIKDATVKQVTLRKRQKYQHCQFTSCTWSVIEEIQQWIQTESSMFL